jgi:NADPH-dependent 2,4-dienoyl-CoA reductase/sulfur reductase-like enzyme
VIGGAAASVAAAVLAAPHVHAQAQPRVVVIGGGFAGASCARALKQLDRDLAVTLVEPDPAYVACPFSNAVVGGLRGIEAQTFDYDRFDGIALLRKRAVGVDAERRRVRLDDGTDIDYARLVLAPGIELNFEALPGYDAPAAEIMPHAWKAGRQTLLLRDQLTAMEDGGVVVLSTARRREPIP